MKRKFYNIDPLVSEENESIIEIDAAKQVGHKDIGYSLDEACPYRQHSGQN